MPSALLFLPLRALLAAGLAANGLAMLLVPDAWYHAVPGVVFTGPLNTHFVRDIGCAYLVADAAVHLGETLAGLCGWSRWAADVPGVLVPALLAAWLSLPDRRARRTPPSHSAQPMKELSP
jgi:hypothetical protein